MKKKQSKFALLTKDLANKYGVVNYILKGMFPAPEYKGAKAPYITKVQFTKIRNLAQAKLAYLLESRNPEKTASPDSYLDLRDGGTETQGLAAKPIMTGWLTYAKEALLNNTFIQGLQKSGQKISRDFDAFVVIGIGGSYTNIQGIIDALNPEGTNIPFYFLGQHLSPEQYQRIFKELEQLPGKVTVNVISKSGTTTEPALALRLVIDRLTKINKLGAVFATTDPEKGALRETIKKRGFNPPQYLDPQVAKDFYIRADIGGRFSVITPVGLLPFAVAGINLKEFLAGYHYAMQYLQDLALDITAAKFAAYKNGAHIAVLAYNVACLRHKILGFRQLWPECNGKNGQGLNIMEEFYTSDAHSNGQLIKSGIRNMMEIFHFIEDIDLDFSIPQSEYNLDKLAVIAQGSKDAPKLHKINNRFMAALLLDHWQAGVPVIAVKIPRLHPFLVAMQMGIEHYSAVLFGLMLGINPVNQPGVQGYKEIAFKLLGMKGKKEQEHTLEALKQFGLE